MGSKFYFDLSFKAPPTTNTQLLLAGRKLRVISPHLGTASAMTELLAARGAIVDTTSSIPKGDNGLRVDATIVDASLPSAELDALTRRVGPSKVVVLARSNGQQLPSKDAVSIPWPVRSGTVENAVIRVLDPANAPSRPAERGLAWKCAPGQRVLLVEDNPVNQVVAQSILEDLGLAVTLAEDGEKALELLDQAAFDLVLMDCQMPTLDGFEATRRWRAKEKPSAKRVPIVALTAQAMAGDEARCIEAGMDGYLSKPLERRPLIAKLQQFLRVGAVSSPTPTPQPQTSRPKNGADLKEMEAFLDAFGRDLGTGAVDKLVAAFTKHMPNQLERLRIAADLVRAPAAGKGNEESLARVAHTLRGAARTVGLGDLGARLNELETLSTSDPTRAKHIALEIEKRLDVVYRAMVARAEAAS